MLLLGFLTIATAQNDTVFHVNNMESYVEVCTNKYDRALIYADENCNNYGWLINYGGEEHHENPIIITQDMGYYGGDECYVEYAGCDISYSRTIHFTSTNVPAQSTLRLWKRHDGSAVIEAVGADSLEMYDFHWSTGETTPTIEVSEPGIYTCGISDQCATATRTFIVRDNVELYRATCDLRSNLNQVTWLTTPAQDEYISAVNIYRNTYQLVATVPYLDGSFTDDIGSESTQWQYHVVAVDNEGNECPIPSYWKRTIHLDHVQGTGGGEILQWTPYEEENPAKDVVVAYAIYDVVNGEPQHVMDVGNFTNVYAYNPNDFDGYGTVAAVFAGKDMEDLAFSNLTSEILDVGETQQKNLSVYPNPTNGTFTVQGTTTLTIYNAMGQVVARSDNNEGKHTLSLAPGVYFIKSDEGAQKVVVE